MKHAWFIGGIIALLFFALPGAAQADEYTVSIEGGLALLSSPFESDSGGCVLITNLFVNPPPYFFIAVWKPKPVPGYVNYFIDSSGAWGESALTSKICRAEGFFIQLPNTITNFPYELTFSGSLVSNAVETIDMSTDLIFMTGYPYLSEYAVSNINFVNSVDPYITGDTIYTWNSGTGKYEGYFYDGGGELGGGWQYGEKPGITTDRVLQPMQGFVIRSPGGIFSNTWQAPAP